MYIKSGDLSSKCAPVNINETAIYQLLFSLNLLALTLLALIRTNSQTGPPESSIDFQRHTGALEELSKIKVEYRNCLFFNMTPYFRLLSIPLRPLFCVTRELLRLKFEQ